MDKIILSLFLLLFFALKTQAQNLTPQEKISDKYKLNIVQMQAIEIQNEANFEAQKKQENNNKTLDANPKERLRFLEQRKANILQNIADLSLENKDGSITPMIQKFEKVLLQTEAEITHLKPLIQE